MIQHEQTILKDHDSQKENTKIRIDTSSINNLNCVCTNTIESKKPLLVVKVGTSTMMQTQSLNFCLSNLGRFVDAVCSMKADGFQVVLVCSGAVGAGCIHLKLHERPVTLEGKQAASAVGQCRMMRLYEDLFSIREQKIAQLIITRPDLMDRTRFINFKNALREILRLDVLPIINENDSIATANLHFGDNDTLAAYVAVSLGAQWLFLLTDVDCLYTKNPRIHSDAKPIPYVSHLDDIYSLLDESENSGTQWGTGGMRTKIIAAKIATATGINTALCHGEHPERVLDVIKFAKAHAHTSSMWIQYLKNKIIHSSSVSNTCSVAYQDDIEQLKTNKETGSIHGLSHYHLVHRNPTVDSMKSVSSTPNLIHSLCDTTKKKSSFYEKKSNTELDGVITAPSLQSMPYLGTIFGAQECTQHICDQRRWILSLPVRGRIYVDDGAAHAVIEGKKSLFAAGITVIEGTFYEGESVVIHRDRCIRRGKQHQLNKKYPQNKFGSILFNLNKVNSNKKFSDSTTKSADQTDHDKPVVISTNSSAEQHYCYKHVMNDDETRKLLTLNDGTEIARCLINFSSNELDKIKGLKSSLFKNILGYECDSEVAHRNNIIFINPCSVYGCHAYETNVENKSKLCLRSI